MAELYMPVMSHFENGNPWCSSEGRLRFLIKPEEDGTLSVRTWEGPWAMEFSIVEQIERFPLTEEGLAQIPPWLEERRKEIEARPKHTLEENIIRRDQAEAANKAESTVEE